MHLIAAGEYPHNDHMLVYHHGQGLAALQTALDNVTLDPDDASALAIIHLVSFEWQLGDTTAFSLHYHGLRRLLALRGTRPDTPAVKVVRILMKSASPAGFASDSPRFSRTFPGAHLLAHPPGAFSRELRALNALLPPCLKEIALMGLVSVSSVKFFIEVGERTRLPPQDAYPSRPPDGILWTRAYSLSNIHSYATHSQTVLDRWLRWALLMHAFQTFEKSYRKTIARCAKNVVEDIVAYLGDARSSSEMRQVEEMEFVRQQEQEDLCHNTRECIIWALFCAAGASETIRKDSEAEMPRGASIGWATVLDSDSVQLMKRGRTMLGFEEGGRPNVETEWGALGEVLARLWCPGWLQDGWEAMYRRMLKHHS